MVSMHIHDTMPKGHRVSRSQGVYRQSPMVPTSASHYSSHPMARSNSQLNSSYYPSASDIMQQPQHTSYTTTSYASGGPVQQPIHYTTQSTQLPSLPPTSSAPPTSIRASSGAWSPHDDTTLMAARASGMNWLPIQQAYFPTKTANACRKRHERLMERRNADDWDGVKLERLATAYMGMRREIWQPLADVVGEKWSVVEEKCMSQGLKNLQTHARSQARRERMMDSSSSLPQNSHSHSHSTSLSSIHSQPHTYGYSTTGNAPGEDSGIGLEIGDLDDAEYAEGPEGADEGSDSERSRSVGSVYGHHASSSMTANGGYTSQHQQHQAGSHSHSNSGGSGGSRGGWSGQQSQMVGMNSRLPSMSESGIGIDSLIHRNGR